MLKIIDNIPALKYANVPSTEDFEVHNIGGKSFEVCPLFGQDKSMVVQEISNAEGCLIKPVLGFYRRSDKNTDPTVRIHNDKYINGETVDGTCIIYLNNCKETTGTAFWKLDSQEADKERFSGSKAKYNNYLNDKAHLENLWTQYEFVDQVKNRMLLYDADLYHSKYPHYQEEERIIIVMFYKRLK
jgi:hypothetical protein